MANFAENLARLPAPDGLTRLELLAQDGSLAATIENQPGSQGSLKVYHHLANKWGAISPAAAADGLALYAEHSEDAQRNPGKHPNIDRLLEIISSGATYTVRRVPEQGQ